MNRLSELGRRLLFLFRRGPFDRDLAEEMRQHVALKAKQLVESGVAPEEARYRARREFGNEMLLKESSREAWQWRPLEELVQDLRYALRTMRRSPGFTAVAVASLALGIGANTAIFSLLNAILLRALPVRNPVQLVQFNRWFGNEENSYFPYPHFERLQQRNHTLSGMFAIAGIGRIGVSLRGQPELAQAELVTGSYYSVLGVNPLVGRLLTPEDDRPGNAVAAISYGYWQRRFGGDPSAVGTTVWLNGKPFTIVGVTPPEFFGISIGDTTDITLPMRAQDQLASGEPIWDQPFDTWLQIMGRLKPNVTRQQAQAELDAICRQLQKEVIKQAPPQNRLFAERMAREARLELMPAATGRVSNLHSFAGPLTILMIVVGVVLLIACANIANLLLARAAVRQKEMAVRLAVGAGRFRLIRQLLTETLLLAAMGGAVGVLVAHWGARVLLTMMTRDAALDLTADLRVLAFTGALSLVTGTFFGLAPALRATRVDLSPAMKESSGIGRSRRRILDRILVAGEVALSLVLLAGAGLFIRTLQNLWKVDAGYNRENVLMFSVDPHLAGQSGTQIAATYRELLAKTEAIPGVRSVSVSIVRPIDDEAYFVGEISSIDGRALPEDKRVGVATNFLGPKYFATLGTPLLLGRDFGPHDSENSAKVAIISETLARLAFPKQNPIGRRIGAHTDKPHEALEIVGVAKDVRYGGLRDEPRGVLYTPFFQENLAEVDFGATVEIRYAGSVSALLDQVRAEIQSLDRNLPMFRVKTLELQAKESLSRERLMATLSSFFGLLALVLASIGLYGLMAYAVVRRTNEIGIRMALGAGRAHVIWLVLRDSMLLVLIGIAIGVPTAMGTARLIARLLFGVKANDPVTFSLATLLMVAVAAFAGYLPARRASRIDPMEALRYE